MADIAASDVTVTIEKHYRHGPGESSRKRVKIAFGNGTLTYPSGGIPFGSTALARAQKFGFKTVLDYLLPSDTDDAQGIVWKWDKDNQKLRGYIQGIVVSAAGAVTTDDFPLDTTAEPLATAVSTQLTDSTGAGTKYLGRLQELAAAAAAPAAQTLYAEAVGV